MPFPISIALPGIPVRIRWQMEDGPAFRRMKAEGTHAEAPIPEAFNQQVGAAFTAAAPARDRGVQRP